MQAKVSNANRRTGEGDVPYEKDSDGNEVYRKVAGVGEIYRNTNVRDDIYAKRKDSSQYYAKDANNKEIYATLAGQPVPIYDANGRPVYAKDADGNEYYYKNPISHRESSFSGKNRVPAYARDKDGNEIYPKNRSKEIILGGRYAEKSNKRPFYPKEKDEYIMLEDEDIKKRYIVWKDKIIYPVSKLDRPMYPLDANNDEYYLQHNNRYQIGRNRWESDENAAPVIEYYARKANGDEFYPPDGRIAHESQRYHLNGYYYLTPKYAFQQSTGHIIYPQHSNGDQYYLEDPATAEDIVTDYEVYAKLNNNREIYPIAKMQGINYERYFKHYAKDENGHEFYALDTNGNEYLLVDSNTKKPLIVMPAGYPITNDNLIIVPRDGDKNPYIVDNLPKIEDKELVSILVRDINNNNDFLTNIQSKRKSRSPKILYKSVPYTSSTPIILTQTKTKIVTKSIFNSPYTLIILSILITLILWVAWFIWIRKPSTK